MTQRIGATRDNGTALAKKNVTFWLFYQQGLKDKATITTDIDKALVHTADLAAPKDKQTQGVSNSPHTPHPFVIAGLKPGTKYSFFLRIIHPESPPTGTPAGTKANERTKYARDTAVAHGTSSKMEWYVSTLAAEGLGVPYGIALASDDSTLYVSDAVNNSIRKLEYKE